LRRNSFLIPQVACILSNIDPNNGSFMVLLRYMEVRMALVYKGSAKSQIRT
jgi:hypothetical protein